MVYTIWFLANVLKQFNSRKKDFSTNGAGAVGHPCAKNYELWSKYHIYTKISWKWVLRLNVKCKSIKTLEKKKESFWDLG